MYVISFNKYKHLVFCYFVASYNKECIKTHKYVLFFQNLDLFIF